jgi:2-polyprenyl-3-methyl-5-hydroxy-6-metoxy-1,4-benzoquinol methylase
MRSNNFIEVPAESSKSPRADGVTRAADSLPVTRYALENGAAQARDRFVALSALFDTGTIRHLEERGVSSGWHCLEVGGGGGSIAAWLSGRVGPRGRVVVTDINTRFLETLHRPNLEVRQHNIVTDALPEAAFDLVHARLVLMHLPEREAVLTRLVAALKPGGWLIDEEFDALALQADPELSSSEEFLQSIIAFHRVLTQRGVDLRFGRLLFSRMRALGLDNVGAEARQFMLPGRSVGVSLVRSNFDQLRETMIGEGHITAQELEHDIRTLDDPGFQMPLPPLWAAWGRRPQKLVQDGENQNGAGIHFHPDDGNHDPLAIMW